eukprot:SAG22_NODE_326_length_12283_cov_248.386408_7_plen_292_part_00
MADAAAGMQLEPVDGPGGGGGGGIVIPDYEDEKRASTAGTFTVDEAIEAVGFGKYQIGVLLMGGLCWMADAMEMLLLSYVKGPLQCEFGISDVEAALITTAVGMGMFFGSTVWGMVADSYGRRFGFLATAGFTFTFGLVSAAAVNFPMMLVARGLCGFGIGGVPVAFSLMMEFLPADKRGTWGMGVSMFWTVGAMFEALMGLIIMEGGLDLGWRWLVAISTLPLGLLLLLWPILPESPRWLISNGNLEEAEAVLRRAAKTNGVSLPPGRLSAVSCKALPLCCAPSSHCLSI